MFTLTTGGIAQASTRPVVIRRRMAAPSCASSKAMSVPRTIVSPTVTAVKATVRNSTVQKLRSWRICE
jgi:hypothetical protein